MDKKIENVVKLIIVLMMSLLFLALTKTTTLVKSLEETFDSPVIYDISEITGLDEIYIDNTFGEKQIGTFKSNENVAVRFNLKMPEMAEYVEGPSFQFFSTQTSIWNEANPGGFYVQFGRRSDTEIYSVSIKKNGFNTAPIIETETLPQGLEAGKIALIEVGVVNHKVDNNKVGVKIYVKVNDEEVLSKNETDVQLGDKLIAPYRNRSEDYFYVYSSKSVGDKKYDVAKEYDFFEITSKETICFDEKNSFYKEAVIGEFETSENVSIKAKLSMPINENYINGPYFGFLKTTNSLWASGGYIVQFGKYSVNIKRESLGNQVLAATDKLPEALQAGKTVQIEVGAVNFYINDVKVGIHIYVKINDETVLSVDDIDAPVVGTKLVSPYIDNQIDSFSLSTSKSFTRHDVAVKDLYDISGKYEIEFNGVQNQEIGLGKFENTKNVAVCFKLAMPETGPKEPVHFGILQDKCSLWSPSGYLILIRNDNIELSYKGRAATLERCNLPDTMKAGKTFVLEFGAVEVFEEGIIVGLEIYAKCDGVTVISAIDTEPVETGNYFVGPYLDYIEDKFTIYTAEKNVYKDSAETFDLWATANVPSVTFDTTKREAVLGEFPAEINVAFKADILLPEGKIKSNLQLSILQSQHTLWSDDLSGYTFFIRDDSVGLACEQWNRTLVNSPKPAILNGGQHELEFGAVKYYVDGEFVGNYVYVKIDGIEIISALDTTPQRMGRNIIGPYLDFDEDSFSLLTTLDVVKVIYNDDAEGVIFNKETWVERNKEAIFNVGVAEGYKIKKVYFNGVEITDVVETYGGYLIKIDNLSQGGIFTFESEKIYFSVNVMEVEGGKFIIDKEEIAYGDMLEVRILPNIKKILSEIYVNDLDCFDSVETCNGYYLLTIYSVKNDLNINAVFTEKVYNIKVVSSENVSVDYPNKVDAWNTVEITLKPNDGFIISEIWVNGKKSTLNGEGKIVFEKVNSDIEIKVETLKVPVTQEPDTKGGCKGQIEETNLITFILSIMCFMGLIKAKRRKNR